MKRLCLGETERAGIPITAVEVKQVIPGRRQITALRWREVTKPDAHYYVLEAYIDPHWQEIPCLSE